MASSTGIVVSAGALSLTDLVLSGWDPAQGIRLSVATVLAALVSSGLDRVIPGLGTGLGVVLLAGVILTSGPRIVDHLAGPAKQGLGSKA
jgi:hypothetical protein